MATLETIDSKTGLRYHEYYLYSEKRWEMAPSGSLSYNLVKPVMQNAPIVVTPSGQETTLSSDPWAKTGGLEKYKKVGYGYFSLKNDGSFDPDANEFSLDPTSSGTIVFNGPVKENVYIEYEAGPSGYYIMRGIDYNPLRNETETGFLHFSKTTTPSFLSLSASRGSIRADGLQGCKLTAVVYDEDYDRVPGASVVFEVSALASGYTAVSGVFSGQWSEFGKIRPTAGSEAAFDASGTCYKVLESSNARGEAYADYVTLLGKTGIPRIKAFYLNASGVYDEAGFYQYYLQSNPFTLDQSQLDTLDYLYE